MQEFKQRLQEISENKASWVPRIREIIDQNAAKEKLTENHVDEQVLKEANKDTDTDPEVSEALRKAQAKFNELDVDGSGELDGQELTALCDYVWTSFNPNGQQLNDETKAAASAELLKLLDTNGDGALQFSEFSAWFEDRCTRLAQRDAAISMAKGKEPSIVVEGRNPEISLSEEISHDEIKASKEDGARQQSGQQAMKQSSKVRQKAKRKADKKTKTETAIKLAALDQELIEQTSPKPLPIAVNKEERATVLSTDKTEGAPSALFLFVF